MFQSFLLRNTVASPVKQLAHLRQESMKTPTPIGSPTLNFVTALPMALTCSGNFMAGYHWKYCRTPFFSDLVDI